MFKFLVLTLCITFLHSACGDGGSMISEKELDQLRQQMVDRQIVSRGVKDLLVLKAMRNVKRHQFVLAGQERDAYEDGPLPIGEGQTISQPYIVALMTELARVKKDSKVLEIGTGSGYQAAVLSVIAKEVYSIEILEKLGNRAKQTLVSLGYDNVRVRIGDGYQGWPEAAPFDSIIVTAAPDHIPQPLIDQLKVGGRMVIPLGDFYQDLEVITKTEKGIERQKVIPVRFVPMTGEAEERNN